MLRALSIGGVWKRQLVGGVQRLVEIELREISIAAVGVNADTLLSTQMAKAFRDVKEGETNLLRRCTWLRVARPAGVGHH